MKKKKELAMLKLWRCKKTHLNSKFSKVKQKKREKNLPALPFQNILIPQLIISVASAGGLTNIRHLSIRVATG